MLNKSHLIKDKLLKWYDANRRELPWRFESLRSSNAYHVWLSEVMLQQTTVATVKSRFISFISRWPTVFDLANATLDEVLHEWQGLGYYTRARNLHKCAQEIVSVYKGYFPDNEADLLKLPGIGEYTAAAIVAIAFGRVSAPVDGNIMRVISRLNQIAMPMPKGKIRVAEIVSSLMPLDRPGDFTQAMMDLGAVICRPKRPKCYSCPCSAECLTFKNGVTEQYPFRMNKKVKGVRCGKVFWINDCGGRVLMRRRPDQGLLAGMMEFPSTNWDMGSLKNDSFSDEIEALSMNWITISRPVKHTFTHFNLSLTIWKGEVRSDTEVPDGVWVDPTDFRKYALPSLMKKVVKAVAVAG